MFDKTIFVAACPGAALPIAAIEAQDAMAGITMAGGAMAPRQ